MYTPTSGTYVTITLVMTYILISINIFIIILIKHRFNTSWISCDADQPYGWSNKKADRPNRGGPARVEG